MSDFMSKGERSRHMSLVHCRDTRLELEFFRLVSAALYPMGFRYRKHCRHVFGTPDLVFAKFKLAVFVDSDFWHGRNYAVLADRMTPFWREKIETNMRRDRRVNRRLRDEGWIVLRFGERLVKKSPLIAVERIKRQLKARCLSA
jgi:DNA mismatch endonuclease (patch repair protein)